MTEQKKEIKINKINVKKNIGLFLKSLLISFTILFIIAIFGKIEEVRDVYDPSNVPVEYSGILSEKYRNGLIVAYGYTDYLNGKFISYDPETRYRVNNYYSDDFNFYFGDEWTSGITLKHKLLIFYLPLIMIEKFWLWMALTFVLILIFKFKNKFSEKYKIKIE